MNIHKKRQKNYSITKRMMITSILMVFLPLIFTGVYGYNIYTSHMEKLTVRLSNQIIFPLQQQIEQTFKQLDWSITPIWLQDELQQLINTPSDEWINKPRKTIEIRKNISDILGWQQSIEGLFIVSSDHGVLYDVVSSPVDTNYPFQNEKFFEKSKEVKDSFVSGPTIQKYKKGGHVFSITRSLRSVPSFQWHGAIHLDIDAEKIFNYFKSVQIGKSGYIVAIDSDGKFVYHPDQSFLGRENNLPYYTNINKNDSGDFFINHDGIEHLVIFDKSDYLGWTFIGIVPKSEMHQGAIEIRNAVLLIGFMCFILMIIVTWRINHIAFQPLHQINNAIRGLGLGDFTSKLDPSRILELQPVVNQYNRTVDQLKNLTETLYTTRIKQHQSEIELQKHLLLKQEAELRQREAELGQLEAQINPHFLYNTLSCIQSLAELEESYKIDRVVGLLSKLFRYSLAQNISKVQIKEELEHVKVFVDIQEIRHEDSIRVFWDVDMTILNYDINRLTIQPLVENAFFHGVEPLVDEGEIRIFLKRINEADGDKLFICVEDNGIGMDPEKLEELHQFIKQQSIRIEESYQVEEPTRRLSGIRNVIKRLYMVYGSDCKVVINSKKNEGTSIKIFIAIK